jgi:hypothetical protein
MLPAKFRKELAVEQHLLDILQFQLIYLVLRSQYCSFRRTCKGQSCNIYQVLYIHSEHHYAK